jgi:hypothetical protein
MDDVEEEATLDKVKQTAERIAKGEGYSAAA